MLQREPVGEPGLYTGCCEISSEGICQRSAPRRAIDCALTALTSDDIDIDAAGKMRRKRNYEGRHDHGGGHMLLVFLGGPTWVVASVGRSVFYSLLARFLRKRRGHRRTRLYSIKGGLCTTRRCSPNLRAGGFSRTIRGRPSATRPATCAAYRLALLRQNAAAL